MKKYFILFFLTISTFLTAQEQEEFVTASKWQIGQGNFVFGTNLSFTDINASRESIQIIGLGDSKMKGNNIGIRNFADFGIFSVGSNGTYLAYGLSNDSMIYFSTDLLTFGMIEEDNPYVLGSNLTVSYIYSKKSSKNFEYSFAPYISLPFIAMGKYDVDEDLATANFQTPFVLGFNFVASLKSDKIFFDLMFNFNLSPDKDVEVSYKDEKENINMPEITSYSFAVYMGKHISDTLTGKAGLLLTSFDVEDVSLDQQLLQLSIENNVSETTKLSLIFEYAINSYMAEFRDDEDVSWLSLIGKMEFMF